MGPRTTFILTRSVREVLPNFLTYLAGLFSLSPTHLTSKCLWHPLAKKHFKISNHINLGTQAPRNLFSAIGEMMRSSLSQNWAVWGNVAATCTAHEHRITSPLHCHPSDCQPKAWGHHTVPFFWGAAGPWPAKLQLCGTLRNKMRTVLLSCCHRAVGAVQLCVEALTTFDNQI
jgi:hypothetical protein